MLIKFKLRASKLNARTEASKYGQKFLTCRNGRRSDVQLEIVLSEEQKKYQQKDINKKIDQNLEQRMRMWLATAAEHFQIKINFGVSHPFYGSQSSYIVNSDSEQI